MAVYRARHVGRGGENPFDEASLAGWADLGRSDRSALLLRPAPRLLDRGLGLAPAGFDPKVELADPGPELADPRLVLLVRSRPQLLLQLKALEGESPFVEAKHRGPPSGSTPRPDRGAGETCESDGPVEGQRRGPIEP